MKIEPLPCATVGQIVGLLEILDDTPSHREDLYELAQSLNMDIDEFSPIVDASEILGFSEIIDGDLQLSEIGEKFIESDINEKKLIFKQQLKKINVFKVVLKILHSSKDNMVDREIIIEEFSDSIPPENAEKLLNITIDWGRFAELIGYNADSEEVYLDLG